MPAFPYNSIFFAICSCVFPPRRKPSIKFFDVSVTPPVPRSAAGTVETPNFLAVDATWAILEIGEGAIDPANPTKPCSIGLAPASPAAAADPDPNADPTI